MRQFNSHQRSNFRMFQSYAASVRSASFSRHFFNMCKDASSTGIKPAAFTKSFTSAFQGIRNASGLFNGQSGLIHSASKADMAAAQWPSPSGTTRKLMAQGALSSIIFGEGICSSIGVSGSAGLCSASSGMGSTFALSLLMQASGSSSFIRAVFYECGAAVMPMEWTLRKCLCGTLHIDTPSTA